LPPLQRFVDYHDPTSLGSRFRRRRAERLRRLIARIHATEGRCRIIDVGGRQVYWETVGLDFLARTSATVHLVNLREIGSAPRAPFTAAVGDARDLAAYADGTFDLAHANSVIEHVGTWEDMKAFAAAFRRVARRHYLQTPNFWFPIEPHFVLPLVHWLPVQMRMHLAHTVGLGTFGRQADIDRAAELVQGIDLLTPAQVRWLFPDFRIEYETVAGLAKSILAVNDG